MHGVFIHDVNPSSPVTGDGGSKDMYKDSGMHFFDTYVGAGSAAYQLDLISQEALQDLVVCCQEDLDSIPFKDAAMKQMRQEELDRDIQQVTIDLDNQLS